MAPCDAKPLPVIAFGPKDLADPEAEADSDPKDSPWELEPTPVGEMISVLSSSDLDALITNIVSF